MAYEIGRSDVSLKDYPFQLRPLLRPEARPDVEDLMIRDRIPRVGYLTVDFTHRCQANCRGCIEGKGRDYSDNADLQKEDLLRLIKHSSAHGIRSWGIYGGEPLMHPNFTDILHALIEEGIGFTVVTNGFWLDKQSISDAFVKAAESGMLRSVRVSLNAGSPEVHAEHFEVAPGKSYFERVVGGARALVDRGVVIWVSYLVDERNGGDLRSGAKLALDRIGAEKLFVRPTTGVHGIGLRELPETAPKEVLRSIKDLRRRYRDRIVVPSYYEDFLKTGQMAAPKKNYSRCPFAAGLRAVISPPSPGQIWSCSYFRGDSHFAAGSLPLADWIDSEERRRAYKRVNPKRDCQSVFCKQHSANAVIDGWRGQHGEDGSLPPVVDNPAEPCWA